MTEPLPLRAPILVFDVNETLLDLGSLQPLFSRLFGEAEVLREWFPELIVYSQTLTLSNRYTPFGDLAVGVLHMVGANHGIDVTAGDVNELRERIQSMPACEDVVPGLERLQEAGFRLFTLTNSAPSGSPSTLEKAGISAYFERHFSVDTVSRFKPHPAVYRQVADELQIETSSMCLIACHAWDVIGAQAVGCQGAFIARVHNHWPPIPDVPPPHYQAQDLVRLADQLISD